MSKARTPIRTVQPATDVSYELRNYRLLGRIRQDELATVYAASHLTLDRPVEVHILRRTDWISASRFQLAARLAARLSHPNLLPVIDAGHDDKYGDYLVTPTLEAQSLHDILAAGPLDPVLALRILTQSAAALDYLHAQQIVHRDVQPANVLVTPEGVVYLTNLSLAASPDTPDLSSIDEADYLTPYSAPEQRLDQAESSPALDVYALGAVLYHMLSGEVPPAPGTDLPSLVPHDPRLAAVDAVLLRMLAVQPEHRFASVEESVAAVRRAMRTQIDLSTGDMEESRWEPVAEWLENPLETVLGKVLEDYAEASEQAEAAVEQPVAPAAIIALHGFEEYMRKSRARADSLHRGDTIRRLLTRWSRKGMFRRPVLGQIIQLEQIVSYNIYFYEVCTLYETRTAPETRRRTQQPEDQRSTLPLPPLWDIGVPETAAFAEVKPQEVLIPNSTHIFTCTTCGGAAEVVCTTCKGTGMVERTRKVRNPDNSITQEAIPEQCPTCRSYGKQQCPTCKGTGNLVEELVFTWSRHARLWQNTDDLEDLPRLALEQRSETICRVPIQPYEGHWHSVAPLDELLQAAIAVIPDSNTRLVAAELQIRGTPMTEIDYTLHDQSQRLYLLGYDNEVIGGWELLNPERIALVALGGIIVMALVVWGLTTLLI